MYFVSNKLCQRSVNLRIIKDRERIFFLWGFHVYLVDHSYERLVLLCLPSGKDRNHLINAECNPLKWLHKDDDDADFWRYAAADLEHLKPVMFMDV